MKRKEMTAEEAALCFMRTEIFKGGNLFTRSDVSNRTKQRLSIVVKAIEWLLDREIVAKTIKDQKGNQRYVKTGGARKLLMKKWRSENVGELAYYKGFNNFGNADTSWRGSL